MAQLIRLLLTFKGELTGNEADDLETMRNYQSLQWGSLSGETCIIEISGIPARNLKAGVEVNKALFEPIEHKEVLQKRVDNVCAKLLEHKPEWVVMYGSSAGEHFGRIEESAKALNSSVRPLLRRSNAPTGPGMANLHWEELGKSLKTTIERPSR